jgi:hypothetical protein
VSGDEINIVMIPSELWAAKAPHGEPCTRCGLCCMVSLCRLAQEVLHQPEFPGPCPALTKIDGGQFACGMVAHPERYAPAGACERHGTVEMGRAAAFLIGASEGCGMLTSGETMNRRYMQQVDSDVIRNGERIANGKRMWGRRP